MSKVPQFGIVSFEDAEEILLLPDQGGFKHVVSLGSTPDRPEGLYRVPNVLKLQFEDVTREEHARLGGYRRASMEDIARLIEFLKPVNEKILFHCAAGISRSAAAACIIVAMRLGHSSTTGSNPNREAMALVAHVKESVFPNKHMIKLADLLLGRNGSLLRAAFKEWPDGSDIKTEMFQELTENREPIKYDEKIRRVYFDLCEQAKTKMSAVRSSDVWRELKARGWEASNDEEIDIDVRLAKMEKHGLLLGAKAPWTHL